MSPAESPPRGWVFLDVDGTLRHFPDAEDRETVLAAKARPGLQAFMERLHELGVGIVVWSAGGEEWANDAVDVLGIRRWVSGVHEKEREVQSAYPGPQFFIDDWPEWLDGVIESHHPRCIVESWRQDSPDAELDCELDRAAREVAAWLDRTASPPSAERAE